MHDKKKNLYLIIIIFVYVGLTFTLFFAAVSNIQGHFGYPLDDTYIHMAVAKHFVTDGNWGLTKGQFTSSSSSPLWTLLVSFLFKVGGIQDWLPFAANLVIGIILVIASYSLLLKFSSPSIAGITVIAAILFTPLPILTLIGMEHTLHILLTIIFVFLSARYLSEPSPSRRSFLFLLLIAPFFTMVRYESFFILMGVIFFLFLQRKFLQGVFLFLTSMVPHILYGIISIKNDWHFLPSSILIKGNLPTFTSAGIMGFALKVFYKVAGNPHISVLILLLIATFVLKRKSGKHWDIKRYMLWITLVGALLHIVFADVGWFYRYEGYLIYLGLFTIGMVLSEFDNLADEAALHQLFFKKQVLPTILTLLILSPFLFRTSDAFKEYPIAVQNIYQQQYQMGLFIRQYYGGKTILANDVGAINYLGDAYVIDIFGLGSKEFADLWIRNQISSQGIIKYGNQVNPDLIVISESILNGINPKGWRKIESWKIPNNVVCIDDVVTFFTTTPENQALLEAHLQKFAPSL
ncbi:MAG: hypothetical protein P8046_02520, partial [Anaerolineales bacterium]